MCCPPGDWKSMPEVEVIARELEFMGDMAMREWLARDADLLVFSSIDSDSSSRVLE